MLFYLAREGHLTTLITSEKVRRLNTLTAVSVFNLLTFSEVISVVRCPSRAK